MLEQLPQRKAGIALRRNEGSLDRCERKTGQVIGLRRPRVDSERNVHLVTKPSERQLAHAFDYDIDLSVAIHPRLCGHHQDQAQEVRAALESLDYRRHQTA